MPTCTRCGCQLEREDLRCPVCALAVPDAGPTGDPGAEILRCDRCGAAVEFTVEAGAPACGFCGSVTHVERPEDPIERAEGYLSFSFEPEGARQALLGWLGTLGFFRPPDLVQQAQVAVPQPLFWVAWLCEAQGLVSWSADSNEGARRARWAPHAGQVSMRFDGILVSASRGLRHDECARLAPHFDVRAAAPRPFGPLGAVVERFDVQRSRARYLVTQALGSVVGERLRAGVISGSQSRNLHAEVVLEGLRTLRVGLPTYVFQYGYRGRSYRALVHGQRAECVFGDAPYSWQRILLVFASVTVGLLALAVVFGFLLSR